MHNPTLCRMLQNKEIGRKYSYNCNFVYNKGCTSLFTKGEHFTKLGIISQLCGTWCKRKGILKKKKQNSIIDMLNRPVVYLGTCLMVYKVIIPSGFVFYRKCGDAVLIVLLLPIVIIIKIKLKLFLISSIKGILSYLILPSNR